MKGCVQVSLLLLALVACAFATSDEGALGTYSSTSKSLSLQFTWKLDGIHDLRLNGKTYSGVVSIETFGRYGIVQVYEIAIPSDDGRERRIELFVVFDENEAVKQATALYTETMPVREQKRSGWRLTASAQSPLRFRPLKNADIT